MSSIDSINALAAAVDNSSTNSTVAANMDSFDFLELFLIELQNQDPLEPMSNADISSQMCGYSQLEQQQLTNAYLLDQLSCQSSLLNSQAVSYIGKTVLAEGDTLAVSNGEAGEAAFDLDKACSSAAVSIYDGGGELVRTLTLDDLQAGQNEIEWDGKDEQGNALDDGVYTYTVALSGYEGEAPTVTQYSVYDVLAARNKSDGAWLLTEDGREISYADIVEVRGS